MRGLSMSHSSQDWSDKRGISSCLSNNAQHQTRQPGLESEMTPPPKSENRMHHGAGKLKGKIALITGAQAVLSHLAVGTSIINTTSVTTYKGSRPLLDYSATKGAIVSFTRSLALSLSEKNIRVNVATIPFEGSLAR